MTKIIIEKDAANQLLKSDKTVKYAIITDDKVKRLYGNKLKRTLEKAGITTEIFSFPNGEKSKRLETIEALANQMVEKQLDRSCKIIALGGGVVGDVAGLLSSLYMRGVPYIQIPTTLLAMVDSSVGGKTGIDLESGKNLLGTFNQPEKTLIDSQYLKTLPLKQIRNGLAEVIKYGVIKDPKLFTFIEENYEKILKLEGKEIAHIIKTSVKIKNGIVKRDEKEKGERMILNYGHTYGHAIERISNYTLLHGYAISLGMVIANKLAVKKDMLKYEDAKRIRTLLKKVGLPTVMVKKPTYNDILSDKKKIGNTINFILPTKIGSVKIIKEKCQ